MRWEDRCGAATQFIAAEPSEPYFTGSSLDHDVVSIEPGLYNASASSPDIFIKRNTGVGRLRCVMLQRKAGSTLLHSPVAKSFMQAKMRGRLDESNESA